MIGRAGDLSSPVVFLNSPDLAKNNSKFLVDVGSELNLLKQKALRLGVVVVTDRLYGLSGINERLVRTMGWANVRFGGLSCRINIVPDSFPIGEDGILGVEFLRSQGAVLSFADKLMTIGPDKRDKISFINHDIFHIAARTK